MFKTIKSRMVLLQTIMIALTMIIVIALFSFFANDYYLNKKMDVMGEAFDSLKNEDLTNITKETDTISYYEKLNFRFIISDDSYKSFYVTGKYKTQKDGKAKVDRHVVQRIERYTDKFHTEKRNRRICGYGKIEENGHTYYVYIYELRNMMNIGMSYERVFLLLLGILAVLIGIIAAIIISNKINRPLKEIEQSAKDAVESNFNIRISENQEFTEMSNISKSMNIMMAQIRKQMNELETEIEHKTIVEERRRQFVNNVAHELKTPLAVISTQVELMGIMNDEEKRKEYYESIMDEVQEMSKMINDMMIVYTAQNDIETMAMETVDISNIVNQLCEKDSSLIEDENLKLIKNIEEDVMVNANEYYISQAIDNYLTNAIKHSIDNGIINVSLIKKEGIARIEVSNQGKQIPNNKNEVIWSMFYKGDIEETLNGQQGSGLGLYLVKNIVILHNGEYGYENTDDGVKFWIELKTI